MSRAVKILDIYQNYISPLTGSNCRFYPTCSEYAKWLFENDNPFVATIKTIARILRCNQFFKIFIYFYDFLILWFVHCIIFSKIKNLP